MKTSTTGKDHKMKLTNLKSWMVFAAIALAAGCNADKDNAQNDFFKADGDDRVNPFVNAQAANGARHDAMLYPQHFEGGHLNSLGRNKVMLMLEDCDNCTPIVVHLVNCGDGDALAQRKASVELYLKTEEGPNTLTFHPAADDLLRISKTESPGDAGAGAGGTPSGGGAQAAAPAGESK